MSELACDDLIIGNGRRKQTDVLSETVHVGNSFFSNGWIVVGEVTPDQFGYELRFRRRKALVAYLGGAAYVFFERLVGFHDGSDCRASSVGFFCDAILRCYQGGESVIPCRGRPVTATNIQHHASN